MSYNLYLTKEESLTLEEWLAYIKRNNNFIKNADGEQSFTNPKTGQKLSFPSQNGDAQVFFNNSWNNVFCWSESGVTFNAKLMANKKFLKLLRKINSELKTNIIGEEGEEHCLPKSFFRFW